MLLTSKAGVRKALRSVTTVDSGDRVIICAYVGADPLDYVADPPGINVYCSDNPVGTNPDGVEDLLRAGANVWFVRRLHAKVYWSSRGGCLIGSANLSTNALGDAGLFETLYHADDIDIEALLSRMRSHCNPVRVTAPVLEAFRRQWRRAHGQVREPAVRTAKEVPTFDQWVADPYRKPFSIVFWLEYDATNLTSREKAAVEEFNDRNETGLGGRYVDYTTISSAVAALPEHEDVLVVHELNSGQLTTQGTTWLRCELITVSNTGQGGSGVRTRLFQVRRREGRVPFQPSGKSLKSALNAFYRAHPMGKPHGTVFATGSRNEKWLVQAGRDSS